MPVRHVLVDADGVLQRHPVGWVAAASSYVGEDGPALFAAVTAHERELLRGDGDFLPLLAAELDAELVPMGSAGVKVMSVVRDLADAYVHAGGQYQWDNAAPVAVARAAGLHCSRVDGSPLVYNADDTSLPDLIVCRPELAEQIIDFVRRHGTA